MKTCSEEILRYLKQRNKRWIFGGTIEREASITHKPSTVARTLRAMCETGDLERQEMKDLSSRWVVQYRLPFNLEE